MLQVQNLSMGFGDQLLFADASFIIGDGERIGVVGRNGHGKSTLFALLLSVWVGRALGRSLSEDLAVATRHVRSLGNEEVLRGAVRVSGAARFRVVTDLARAIEDLEAIGREHRAGAAYARAANLTADLAIARDDGRLALRGLALAQRAVDAGDPATAAMARLAPANCSGLATTLISPITGWRTGWAMPR